MTWKQDVSKGMRCNSTGEPHSPIGRMVCVSVHPGKMVLRPFFRWFYANYHGRYRYARIMFAIDMFLIGVAATLSIIALLFFFNPSPSVEDQIEFSAVVAPREIVSGAPSTLVIRYRNASDHVIKDASLTLDYPDHFLLQELDAGSAHVEDQTVQLDTLEIGAQGSVRVRGVMFGDVGGEQTFTSRLTFTHDKQGRTIAGARTDTYTFSPVRSTLALDLELPDRLVANQPIDGIIYFKNTGNVDVPELAFELDWPEGFSMESIDAQTRDGRFIIPSVEAGETGAVHFSGRLGSVAKILTFSLHPFFRFDQTVYRQEPLRHEAEVVPPQIQLTTDIEKASVNPGQPARVSLQVKNTGDQTVRDIAITLSSESPYVSAPVLIDQSTEPALIELTAGEEQQITATVQLRPFIYASETETHQQLTLDLQSDVTYTTTEEGVVQKVTIHGPDATAALSSQGIVEAFARYTTASGDQLGRGPLPPRVGSQTRYWIFWNIDGTTNTLKNVRIHGTLPPNVRFTGKQSTSQEQGIEFNPDTRQIEWELSSVAPTLAPDASVVGVAFEVVLIPTDAQIGTAPPLVQSMRLTGTDTETGALFARSAQLITTELPKDERAAGNAHISP